MTPGSIVTVRWLQAHWRSATLPRFRRRWRSSSATCIFRDPNLSSPPWTWWSRAAVSAAYRGCAESTTPTQYGYGS